MKKLLFYLMLAIMLAGPVTSALPAASQTSITVEAKTKKKKKKVKVKYKKYYYVTKKTLDCQKEESEKMEMGV